MNIKKRPVCIVTIVMLIIMILTGCGGTNSSSKQAESTPTNGTAGAKTQPDTMTKVKIGIPSLSLQYWPWFVANKEGIFKKYNLDVELVRVESGVVALRGLQTGDFKFISSLPESVIVGASEGANVKFIGTLTNQSMYSAFASPEMKDMKDLKGKVAGTFQPGNGTDMQLRWWLKKNGMEPDKDIRIINSGGNLERFTALKNGNVQVTFLTPPFNFQAEDAGFKKIALMRDELSTYNHDTIVANGSVIKGEPAVARAFMSATAEAIEFIKNSANREKVIKIGMEETGSNQDITVRSLDFLLPSFPDSAKLIPEGVQWAITTCKEVGVLKKDISFKDVADESFYSKK